MYSTKYPVSLVTKCPSIIKKCPLILKRKFRKPRKRGLLNELGLIKMLKLFYSTGTRVEQLLIMQRKLLRTVLSSDPIGRE